MPTVPKAKLTAKSQITIPKVTREFLKIGPGDEVKLFIHPDGHVAILPAAPISKLRGIVSYRGKSISIEEMDKGVTKVLAERDSRSRSER